MTYATKSTSNSGWAIHTNGSDNAKGSGVASIANPVGVAIEKIIVVQDIYAKEDGTAVENGTLVVKVSNEANKVSDSAISLASDAVVLAAVTEDDMPEAIDEDDDIEIVSEETFTYIPEDDYCYFSVTSKGENAARIKSIEVLYKEELVREQPVFIFDEEEMNVYFSDLASSTEGCITTSNTVSLECNGERLSVNTISYSSDDSNIAELRDAEGTIKPMRPGEATITVSYPGSRYYMPAEGSYKVTIGVINPEEFASSEGLPRPVILDEYRDIMTYDYIESQESVAESNMETSTLYILYEKGYELKYNYTLNTTASQKIAKSPVAASDDDTEMENTVSDGSYFEGVFNPSESAGVFTIYAQKGEATSAGVIMNMAQLTGVEMLEVPETDAEVIYYNLQGQRVKNPDRGIYIRVSGNRADKVAL